MSVTPRLFLMALLALAGCEDVPESFKRPPPPPAPRMMPPADGAAADIVIGDGYHYVVNYQGLEQAEGKVFLRVARLGAPGLTYSDGLLAKKVAEAYCGRYNRPLNRLAFGMYSQPAAWMFEGGCG